MTDRDPIEEIFTQLDQPVAPSPRFAHDLRARLMAELDDGFAADQASARAHEGEVRPMQDTLASPLKVPTTRRIVRDRRWKVTPAIEIAAAILLLLGAVGGFFAARSFQSASPGAIPAAATPAPSDGPAAMAGGDAARTGRQPGPGPTDGHGVRWQLPSDRDHGIGSPPVALGDTLYLVVDIWDAADETNAGRSTVFLQAIDVATGDERWRVPLDVWGSPAVTTDAVYVTVFTPDESSGSMLVALDAATGDQRWQLTTGDPSDSFAQSPVVVGNTVYAVDPDGTVYAVDAATGKTRWVSTEARSTGAREKSPTGPPPITSSGTFAVGDTLVYVVNADGELAALETASGRLAWSVDIRDRYHIMGEMVIPVAVDGAVLIRLNGIGEPREEGPQAARQGWRGFIAALDAASGDARWQRSFSSITDDIAVTNGLVLVPLVPLDAAGPSKVVALDLQTGEPRWTFDGFQGDQGSPVGPSVVGDVAYVANRDGTLHALNAMTGAELWRASVSGPGVLFPVAIADGAAFVLDSSGNLTAFGDASAGMGRPMASDTRSGA